MAIKKEKKAEILSGFQKMLGDSKSVVFVNFNKLMMKDSAVIRRSLKGENVSFVVTKKSLVRKALDGATIKGDRPELDGQLSVAYGEDLLAPARSIYEFQKKLDGKVNIVGGVFDGEYKSKEEMVSIAMIPGENVLRGMFVNIINSPIQRFVIALGQIAEKKS